MKQFWSVAIAATLLTACSDGNPFEGGGGGGTDPVDPSVPAEVRGDLGGFSYNAATQTLTVSGISLDATPISGSYTRNAALDRAGYQAYTTQESGLDRHSTAYVREISGTRSVLVVTGSQFGYYFGGAAHERDGAYTPPAVTPTSGLASYLGNYVGLTNVPGSTEDLLPVPGGTPALNTPNQAAEVTGRVLINADFADNAVNGAVTNRVLVDTATAIEDLELAPTAINADGTFSGSATQEAQARGSYGGVFGGTNASVVAGSLFAADHVTSLDDEEEYGIFVLIQCGTAGADPLCD